MVLNGNPISGAKFNTYTTTTTGVILFHQLYLVAAAQSAPVPVTICEMYQLLKPLI
jgi:hypothetical protein